MVKRRRVKSGSKSKVHRKIRGGRRVRKRPIRRYRRYKGSGPLDFFTNMLPGSELGGNLNDMANTAMNLLPMLL